MSKFANHENIPTLLMTHFFTRFIMMILTPLLAALLFIRMQPYDDHEARDFLLPENCPSPCLLGIRPGGTTVNEALVLLQNDARVEMVNRRYDPYYDRPIVNWSWRAAAASEPSGFVYLLDESEPRVEAMQANPGIAMGYINLILGEPTCRATAVYPFDHNLSYFVLVYGERLLVASVVYDARYHFDYRAPGHLEYISQATRTRIGYPDSLCERRKGS